MMRQIRNLVPLGALVVTMAVSAQANSAPERLWCTNWRMGGPGYVVVIDDASRSVDVPGYRDRYRLPQDSIMVRYYDQDSIKFDIVGPSNFVQERATINRITGDFTNSGEAMDGTGQFTRDFVGKCDKATDKF